VTGLVTVINLPIYYENYIAVGVFLIDSDTTFNNNNNT
jgi:hypothetical protein